MAKESEFVAVALEAATEILKYPLSIRQSAPLLYEITVDNELVVKANPQKPSRGDGAFQTDLCVFEEKSVKNGEKSSVISLPRVVLEFKTRLTTHDVLTYSAKARKHKQVYPYLRYGLVGSDVLTVPKRFFIHNESLDFCAALESQKHHPDQLKIFFEQLIDDEVKASQRLEKVAFGKEKPTLFRSEIQFK